MRQILSVYNRKTRYTFKLSTRGPNRHLYRIRAGPVWHCDFCSERNNAGIAHPTRYSTCPTRRFYSWEQICNRAERYKETFFLHQSKFGAYVLFNNEREKHYLK